MAIQYSGSAYVNRLFTPANRADLINNVTQALFDAGWNNISGVVGSGSDVVMETPATNAGCKIRLRCQDLLGVTNSIAFTIRSPNGATTDSNTYYVVATSGFTYRIIANKYTMYLFQSGSGSIASFASRNAVFVGTVWTPTFLTFTSGDGLGWIAGNGTSDSGGAGLQGLRSSLRNYTSSCWSHSVILQSSTWNCGTCAFTLNITVWQGGSYSTDNSYRWADGTLPIYEAYLALTYGGSNAEQRWYGQLYDATVINGGWASETSLAYDAHTWMTVTDSAPNTGRSAECSLFLAIT
jgi:hypothetical protein